MNNARTVRPRLRAWVATLLTAVLVAGGITLTAAPASAAAGDVTGATLSWGVKESFRNYIGGPIAHGTITLDGVAGPAPYGWSSGSGTADQASAIGSVSYPGSINFYGHDGALNLTFADLRVEQSSATEATLYAGASSLATLNLAGGTNASDATTVAFTGVPAALTAEGATAFAGFYGAGTALDPVSFSWPVEQPAGPAATTTSLTASPATPAATGSNVTLTATVSPAAEGTVQFSDGATPLGTPVTVVSGAAQYSSTAFTAGAHSFTAAFTPADTASYLASTSDALAFELAAPVPTITVSKTTGISPAGETLTITGTGFAPQPPATTGTRPPLAGQFGGTYVVFGKFPETWKPSAAVPSSARKVGAQRWVVNPANVAALGSEAVAINADGSFTVELPVKPGYTGEPAAGNYGIYTYGGSGASYQPFETYTPISFSTAPTVSVSKTTNLSPLGETLTVSGWNFGPNAPATNGARPPLAGQFGGSYVVFGKFPEAWKPSAAVPSSARKIGTQRWVVNPANVAALGSEAVAINPDGSFTVQLPVAPGYTGEPAAGNYGIYTFGGSGSNYAPFETYTPISFAAPAATTTTLTGDPATGLVGDTTTLTATVAPQADGVVTFKDGATVLGSSAVVSGVATYETEALTTGEHAFTAEFVPANALLFGASGGSLSVVVTETPVPTITVSKTTGISPAGETLTITGTGFSPQPPATTGTRPPLAGQFGGSYVVFGKFPEVWKPSALVPSSARKIASQLWVVNPENVAALGDGAVAINPDGSFSIQLAVKPGYPAEPATGNYGVYTYGGSGASYLPFETYTPISFAAATATATTLAADPAAGLSDGDTTTLTATVAPAAAGTVTFSDGATVLGSAPVAGGKAVLTTEGLAAGTHAFTADFAPTEPLQFAASSGAVSVDVSSPTLTNPLTWGVKESFRAYVTGPIAHGAITTSGVGIADGAFVFGSTSGGTYSGETGTGTAKYTGSVRFTGHDGALDLEFSSPIVRVDSAGAAVLFLSANGSDPIPFANLDLVAATKSTTDSTITWAGAPASLTADGATAFAGFYAAGTVLDPVTFVVEATESPEVPAVPTRLALSATPAGGALVGATVTLSATVSPAAAGAVRFYSGSTLLASRPVTAGAASATQTFTASAAGVSTLRAEFVPTNPAAYLGSTASFDYTVTAPVVAAGSLTWGVKASFRDYVTGGIAKGSIATSGVGTEGGAFVFGQSTGGTFTQSSGTGTSNYSGSVRFTGHAGQLDLTLANPVVSVDSANSATLYVTVNSGASVPFATLDLGAGTRSTPGNAVAWSGVPASLTSVGATAFSYNGSSFYSAGTALDPVSFVIGSTSSQGGGTETVAAYQGEREPAATPPATEGITVVNSEKVVAGGEITITADGFQSGEDDILVVIYSTPVVLSRTASADAAGHVTWTGRLPAGLTGTHTLTLQGSVNRGVVLDIPARMQLAATGCPVQSSTLTWGFKESFRSYISGSIANGEWTVADGATYETPNFGWVDGAGSYDSETGEGLLAFTGSVTFTGHGGILNTTISNPQVRFIDGDTAVILVDVSGTTQEGAAIDQKEVEFVDLDTTDAITSDEGVVTVTDAPAILTAAGSEAFGTYETGEEFDPVTIELGIDPACATIAEPEATATDAPTEPVSSEANLWWLWLVGGLVLLAAIAAVIVVVVRRRAA